MTAVRLPIWRFDISLVDVVVLSAYRTAEDLLDELADIMLYSAALERSRVADGGGIAVVVRRATGLAAISMSSCCCYPCLNMVFRPSLPRYCE